MLQWVNIQKNKGTFVVRIVNTAQKIDKLMFLKIFDMQNSNFVTVYYIL